MINLMNENDLAEIEVEREGIKIKLKKSASELSDIIHQTSRPYHIDANPTAVQSDGPSAPADSNNLEIKSPMVGTFYRAPSPEAPSFVEVGQIVEVGQVVCIVEAMKLMNEIKSEVKGKVVEVLVDNAQPVEFGQMLFSVEPL